MAIIQKVIVLNTPFKLFGFTFMQLVILLVAALLGLWIGSLMPPIKIGPAPLNVWVIILTPGAAMTFIAASQMKSWQWWRNRIFGLANLLPTQVLPKPRPAPIYLDDGKGSDSGL